MSLGYSRNSQNSLQWDKNYFLSNTKTQSDSFSHQCTEYEYELFIDIVSEALHSAYFFGDMDLKKLNISDDKDDAKYYGYFKKRSKEFRKDILENLLNT